MRFVKGKLARELRGKAHALKPVVMIGKGGVSEGVVEALDRSLDAHEVLKVKVHDMTDLDRDVLAQELAALTKSYVVSAMGKIITLYRPALLEDGTRPTHPQMIVDERVLQPKPKKASEEWDEGEEPEDEM